MFRVKGKPVSLVTGDAAAQQEVPHPHDIVYIPFTPFHPIRPVKRSTGHTHTHTTAEQTTHTSTERATAQRRLIVEPFDL